jgi:mono/diheme cytochrome c family protein
MKQQNNKATWHERHGYSRAASLALCWLLAAGMSLPAQPQEQKKPAAQASPQEAQRDLVAARYLTTCAGCHSLTGVKLTGPDLSNVGAWPVEQLRNAIKKMESKVGPLSDKDVAELADLLRDQNVRDRLKAEEARIAAMFTASLEPPDATIGRALFWGEKPLKNGGLACAACHSAEGKGGNLGPDLNGVYAKTGDMALMSGLEKSGYKIMGPHYRQKPITRQEAAHLAKYLSTLDPKVAGSKPPITMMAGTGAAALMLVCLAMYYKRIKGMPRGKLQRRR